MLPQFPPLVPNCCKTCCALDYDKQYTNGFYVRKKKMEVRNPFQISKVPLHLKKAIFTKMHYTAFARIRQTNKEYYEYIQTRREQFGIAMFHDRTIRLAGYLENGQFVPYIKFNSLNFWDDCCDSVVDNKELDQEIAICLSKKPTFIEKLLGRNSAERVMLNKKLLFVNLENFLTDMDFQREFIGIYKPISVTIHFHDVPFTWDSPQWLNFGHFYIQFLRYTSITELTGDITLEAVAIDESIIIDLCEELKPKTLALTSQNSTTPNFLFVDCFEKSKTISFVIPNLEVKELFNFERINTMWEDLTSDQFQVILRAWIKGESKTSEMWLGVKDVFESMAAVPATELSESDAKKWAGNVLGVSCIRASRVFLLEQTASGKKAVCAVLKNTTRLGHGVYKKKNVYFNVIN